MLDMSRRSHHLRKADVAAALTRRDEMAILAKCMSNLASSMHSLARQYRVYELRMTDLELEEMASSPGQASMDMLAYDAMLEEQDLYGIW